VIAEFLHSAAYAAVQEPIKGVSQIVDHIAGTKLADSTIANLISAPEKGSGTADWMAQNLGGAAGMLVPFLLVRGGARGLMGESLKGTQTAATLGMSLKEAGLTGFIYDSVLKPTDANATGNFWVNRGLSGVSGAATFMTLTGAAYGMGKFSTFAESKAIGTSSLVPLLRNPIAAGMLSGLPAGLVAAEGSTLVNQHRLATGQEIGGSIAGMAFVGGVFGANEVIKSNYTDGKSIPGFMFDKAKTSWAARPEGQSLSGFVADKAGLAGWNSPLEGQPQLAGGDTVGPDGAKFSVAPDGTAYKGTKASYLDRLTVRPESAQLQGTSNIGTNGAGVVRADVYQSNEGGKPLTWNDYELTRPDGSKATYNMVRTAGGDKAYVYREGNNQVVLKFEDGWQHPKGIAFPRGDATANVHVRVDSTPDMINVHPVVVDALINDPVLKPLVADWQSQDIVQAINGTLLGKGESSKGFVIYPKNEEATQPIADRLSIILAQKTSALITPVAQGRTTAAVGDTNRVTVTREALQSSVDSSPAQPVAKLDESLSAAIKTRLAVKAGEQPTDAQLKDVETSTGLQSGLLGIDSQGALVMKVSASPDSDNYAGGVYLPDTGSKDQARGDYTDRRAYYELARDHGLEPTTSQLKGAKATTDAVGEPSSLKIKIPKVEAGREQDFRDGMNLLNSATRDGATKADLDNFIQYAQEARGVGVARIHIERDASGQEIQVKETMADLLRELANQLRYPEDAHNLVDHAYAIPEAKGLLKAAASDEATDVDRASFEEYVRKWGGSRSTAGGSIRDELATAAQALKNADIARALVDKAYTPRTVNIQVEPGQQVAFAKGLAILQDPNGLDAAKLEQFAKPTPVGYGPGMEDALAEAAGQLRLGADAQVAILQAYHGAAMKEGVALLKAKTLDQDALAEFAAGNGKALHAEMAGAAAELGLPGEAQRAILEAYKGKQAWVDVEGTKEIAIPVPPEKESAYMQAIEIAKILVDPSTVDGLDVSMAPQYRQLLRSFLQSPDNAALVQPLMDYFKLAQTYADANQTPAHLTQVQKAGALMREAAFGTENERITGRPDTVQIDFKTDVPEQGADWQNRIGDFDDLANELARAPTAKMDDARSSLMNWLDRNPDMHPVAAEYARQSADSRVVSAIDSYLGTNNMEPFFEGKARYEKVASTITPDLVTKISQNGIDLFWDLAPQDPKELVKWGGETHAAKIPQAITVDIPAGPGTPEEKTVTAYFKRHPLGISEIEDQSDGTRTITYNAETAAKTNLSVIRQLTNGETIKVLPDESWYSQLSNGNLVEEFSDAHLDDRGRPSNVKRHIRENGVDTYLYRDGTVETGKDGQFASNADEVAREAREHQAEQQQTQQTAVNQPSNVQINELAAKLAPDSGATYADQNVAAITLKDHFGAMTDNQFTDWLAFARGSHIEGGVAADAATQSAIADLAKAWGARDMTSQPKEIANWQKLRSPGIETLVNNPEITKLMENVEGRDLVRNFLDSPESATDTRLQLSGWLSNPEFSIPPEQWPEWLLNDVRARFKLENGSYSPSLPDSLQQYLADNPERTQQLDGEKYPPRAVTMRRDDLPGRLTALSSIVDNVPTELQEPLLRLGAEDARATADVLKIFEPPTGRGKVDPQVLKDYTELLKMTVPNAPDIYTVRTMLNAIKQVGYAAKGGDAPAAREAVNQNVAIATDALAHMSPDGAKAVDAASLLTSLIAREKEFAARSGNDKGGDRGDRDRNRGDRGDRDSRDGDRTRRGKPGEDDPVNRGGDGTGPAPVDIEEEFGPDGPEGEDGQAAAGGVDEELKDQFGNWQDTVEGIPPPE